MPPRWIRDFLPRSRLATGRALLCLRALLAASRLHVTLTRNRVLGKPQCARRPCQKVGAPAGAHRGHHSRPRPGTQGAPGPVGGLTSISGVSGVPDVPRQDPVDQQ